jgi:hypothetical protein
VDRGPRRHHRAGFALDRTFKHYRPEAYGIFSETVWTIEGLFIALAIFGLIYSWATGRLLSAPA